MPMNKTILLGILLVGIASMMMFPLMNAMASDRQGVVTFVNKADKHGKITEDLTNEVYQFQIPQGLDPLCAIPVVVDTPVFFDTDPDQAKVARNVSACGYWSYPSLFYLHLIRAVNPENS